MHCPFCDIQEDTELLLTRHIEKSHLCEATEDFTETVELFSFFNCRYSY